MYNLRKILSLIIFSCIMLLAPMVTAAQRVEVSELSTPDFFHQLNIQLESIGAPFRIYDTRHLGISPEAPNDDVFLTHYDVGIPIYIFVKCNSKHEIYSVVISTKLLNSEYTPEADYLADRLKYPILGVCTTLCLYGNELTQLNALNFYAKGKPVITSTWCSLGRRRIYMKKSYYKDRYYVDLWATDK